MNDKQSEVLPDDFRAWMERSDSWVKRAQEFQVKMRERGDFSKNVFDRLNMLANDNLNLEYIAIGSQLIEEGIKELIEMYVLTINFIVARNELHTHVKLMDPSFNDTDTLGSLIKILKRYCANKDLLDNLDSLNKLRKEVVHKLHEKKKPLSEINESFKVSVDGNLIGTINLQILEQGRDLSLALGGILKKNVPTSVIVK